MALNPFVTSDGILIVEDDDLVPIERDEPFPSLPASDRALDANGAKLDVVEHRVQSLEKAIEGCVHLKQLDALANKVSQLDLKFERYVSKLEEMASLVDRQSVGKAALEPSADVVDSSQQEEHTASSRSVRVSASNEIILFLDDDRQYEYSFGFSTWDSAVFIGSHAFGSAKSVLAGLMLMLKIIMQIVFVTIIIFSFHEPAVDQETIDGALAWRARIAHDLFYSDRLTKVSLAARVCSNDISLELSGAQEQLVESLDDYLQTSDDIVNTFFGGTTMCCVALLCWYLMVSREMSDACDLFSAMVMLPWSATRIVDESSSDEYVLQSISRNKAAFMTIVLAYRLGIASALLYAGTFFLVYTIDVTELILNAVAMEIVLQVDELIFAAMATSSTKNLISKMKPLRMRRWPHMNGVDLKAFLTVLLLPTSIIAVYYAMVEPMVEDLKAVRNALCGGNKDFIWTVNKLKMRVMASTTPYEDSLTISENETYRDIREAIQQEHEIDRRSLRYAMWGLSYEEVVGAAARTLEEELDILQPQCQDLIVDVGRETPTLTFLRHFLKDDSITTCSDVKTWCTSVSYEDLPDWKPDGGAGIMARAICPKTCGCFDLRSSIFVTTGCPSFCTKATNSDFAESLAKGTCIHEPSVEMLRSSPEVTSWLHQMRIYARVENKMNLLEASNALQQEGCAAIKTPELELLEPCGNWHGLPFKTLRNMCPRTCGCLDKIEASCPSSCHYCSNQYCTDIQENGKCLAGTTSEPCSCSKGLAVVYGDADKFGYESYTCCTDGSGAKDVCGKFTADSYCDVCNGRKQNSSAVYGFIGFERPCSVGIESCRIPHQCSSSNCEALITWFMTDTECCMPE